MRLRLIDSCPSTQDLVRSAARGGEPAGYVVRADHQTAGRGQRGRRWLSEPGQALLLSALAARDLPADRLALLPLAAAVAVAEALDEALDGALSCRLKWPNDLLLGADGKKAGGLLVETVATASGMAAVIGLGLNVNQPQFPPELAGSATSLAIETGLAFDPAALAPRFGRALCESPALAGAADLLDRFRARDATPGRIFEMSLPDSRLRGVAEGIDDSGRLLLRLPDGRLQAVGAASSVRERPVSAA